MVQYVCSVDKCLTSRSTLGCAPVGGSWVLVLSRVLLPPLGGVGSSDKCASSCGNKKHEKLVACSLWSVCDVSSFPRLHPMAPFPGALRPGAEHALVCSPREGGAFGSPSPSARYLPGTWGGLASLTPHRRATGLAKVGRCRLRSGRRASPGAWRACFSLTHSLAHSLSSSSSSTRYLRQVRL